MVTMAEYSAALSSTYPAARAAVENTRSAVSFASTDSLSVSCITELGKNKEVRGRVRNSRVGKREQEGKVGDIGGRQVSDANLYDDSQSN